MKTITRFYIATLILICFFSCSNNYTITRDYIESSEDIISFNLLKFKNNNPLDTNYANFIIQEEAFCANDYSCNDKPKKKVYFNGINDCYFWDIKGILLPRDTLTFKLENGYWYSIGGLKSGLDHMTIYFYLFKDGNIKKHYSYVASSNI